MTMFSEYTIHKLADILNSLDYCIINKKPFSVIRYGDGGIKFLHALFYNDREQISEIIKKEGLPGVKLDYILKLWGYYSRKADYIDTPQVYFEEIFWPRLRTYTKRITDKTFERLLMWQELYFRAEMFNVNYCNPELNYLSILDDRFNIFDVMRGRKTCIITAVTPIKSLLREDGYDVDILKIVGQYGNQYRNSFSDVVEFIEAKVGKYDLWLIAAGELGRLYSGLIKEKGGRTFDIGFIAEFWDGEDIHPRLHPFLMRSEKDPKMLSLHGEGLKYQKYI